MPKWKIALASLALFTFVGLPAVGQEMDIPSLKKLDLLAWSSEIMMSKSNTPQLDHHAVNVAEETGEFGELKVGLDEVSMASEHEEEETAHSLAGEPELATEGFLHFLRKIFSSAMDF